MQIYIFNLKKLGHFKILYSKIFLMNNPTSNFQRNQVKSPNTSAVAIRGDSNGRDFSKKEKLKEQLSAAKMKAMMVSNALKKSSSQGRSFMDTVAKGNKVKLNMMNIT